jgi:hypothetical protein
MRSAQLTLVSAFVLTLGALPLTGCDDDAAKPAAEATAAGSTAAASPAATAAATGKAKAAAEPICQREDEKTWGKWANTRTGITATPLPDGRIALGVALGSRPHTLVFDRQGKAELSRVKLKEGTELTKKIEPQDGVRHLQRVTVTAGGRTFADYRDKYTSKRRRVACGPTDGKPPLLLYDGTPLVDTAHYQPPGAKKSAKTPSAAPTATSTARAVARAAAGKWTGPGKASPAAKRIAPRGADADQELLREVRDCRTFVDPEGKDLWAMGTELVGKRQDDGGTEWTMHAFVAADEGRRRVPLHKVILGKDPDKLYTFEAPVAHRLKSGSYVLAARYRGQMFTWLLGADKSKKGSLYRYGGGYPSLPRIIADGSDHLLLTSQKVDLSHWKLRAIRLDARHAKLIESLEQPRVGEEDASLAEPTFARAGDQRWLAYHQGERRKGRVVVVPVNEELAAEGRAIIVTSKDQLVYESHLFGLDDGRLLLVYITRRKGAGAELVSEVLRCKVTI